MDASVDEFADHLNLEESEHGVVTEEVAIAELEGLRQEVLELREVNQGLQEERRNHLRAYRRLAGTALELDPKELKSHVDDQLTAEAEREVRQQVRQSRRTFRQQTRRDDRTYESAYRRLVASALKVRPREVSEMIGAELTPDKERELRDSALERAHASRAKGRRKSGPYELAYRRLVASALRVPPSEVREMIGAELTSEKEKELRGLVKEANKTDLRVAKESGKADLKTVKEEARQYRLSYRRLAATSMGSSPVSSTRSLGSISSQKRPLQRCKRRLSDTVLAMSSFTFLNVDTT
ncbi:hypothetical protein [Nesterenkonia pannonica]|uniref:hypothetical protein n=1 Tax=Nesterenkonia pannonica TaxID=1548602 RepID=UPI0021649FE8|nr:hypothetical protein [Nesterenkonia pannonica]